MHEDQHQNYLKLALAQAEIQRGFCAPNPAVGAVVVKNNQVIASGYHMGPGTGHAEVAALKILENKADGAAIYVTLEPCCHWGRTPPCTDLIIKSNISQVFYGFADPNPQVAGKGAAQLRAAGIQCQQINLPEINDFYTSYAYWWRTKKPWVTAKLALSLDGKIAGKNKQRINITGPECQKLTHQWRKKSDAILTTAQTIIDDDPALNVRLDDQLIAKPVYIIDRQVRLPKTSQIFNTAKNIKIFSDPAVNLEEMISYIGEQGVHDLWVEAGGQLFSALLKDKLAQRALIYIAPKILGSDALNAFNCNQDLFASAKSVHWQMFGKDVCCELKW